MRESALESQEEVIDILLVWKAKEEETGNEDNIGYNADLYIFNQVAVQD